MTQDVIYLGMPQTCKWEMLHPIAPLPGISVFKSWMRKYPPKAGLVFCSLCVVTLMSPNPSSAPSVGTELQHVKNKALTTVAIRMRQSIQNADGF
jgi:hypothetical protein